MSSSHPRTKASQPVSATTPIAYRPTPIQNFAQSLQRVPSGPSPMQHYVGKLQTFEQVPQGLPTQRKDMADRMQRIMRPFDGGAR